MEVIRIGKVGCMTKSLPANLGGGGDSETEGILKHRGTETQSFSESGRKDRARIWILNSRSWAQYSAYLHPSHRLSVFSVSLCFQSPGVLEPGKHRGTETQSFLGKRE